MNRGAAATKRILLELVGWTLVLAGIAALILPGPGLLMMFGGLVVLSQQYEWAERRLEPVERRAMQAAAEGVRTWPRIIGSALGATWLVGLGIYWIVSPPAPSWWPVDEKWWLFGGLGTGITLIASGLLAFGLLIYSFRRFRGQVLSGATNEEAVANTDDDPSNDRAAG
ncbi:PGPGW domain-containing protein [Nocardioides jensenii]|uniref:PGPGW domain-containing protein n=1 Tax=Nocardioides jensenii TaxID=1843 RepID=UPI000833A09D|nr:PGPGW domain-containing protein [Nocardioides jensenii]